MISPEEKDHWDQLIIDRHYLENADLVGRQLRYVAELDGEWVALLGWNTACYHLRDRDEEVGWDVEQRLKRLKFIAQNSRYLLLVERGRYPNLASRILSLCTARLSEDWQAHFGHPLLAVESFVDPERFGGACYRASGCMHLGKTKGFRRHRRDFYQQDSHPKDLWFRWLKGKARRWLSAETMPPRWAQYEEPVAYCPFSADELRSLWSDLQQLADPRGRKGRLYSLGGVLTLCAAATLCGCRGTRAIADFGRHLNQKQLRMLRCYRNKRTGRYQAPSEPTIRWILTQIPASEFNRVVTEETLLAISSIVTPEGFPVAYEVMPGNTSDKTTLPEFLRGVEAQYGKMNRLWIMDRGIPTEEALERMRTEDSRSSGRVCMKSGG